MQSVHGDNQGVFRALNPHVHVGGHAHQHPFLPVESDLGGIPGHAGGGVGYLADGGDGAGEGVVTDGADGDLRLLPLLQGQNVRFVNADGDGHLLLGVQGENLGFRCGGGGVLVIFHAGHQAVLACQHRPVPVDGQKACQGVLQILPLAQQRVKIRAGFGVAQGHQGGACGDVGVFLAGNALDRAHIAGDGYGGMDVQLAGAQGFPGGVGYGDFLVQGRAVVRDQHGDGAKGGAFHSALHRGAVGQGDGDGIASGAAVGFKIHGHVAVHAQKSQSPVFGDAGNHVVACLGVNLFHPAAYAGGDAGGGGVGLGAVDFLVQGLDLILSAAQGVYHGSHVHLGKQIALGNRVSGLGDDLVHLHTGGDGHVLLVHLLQHAAAGDQGVNRARSHGVALYVLLGGGEPGVHVFAQMGNHHHQSHENHRNDDNYPAQPLAPALLLFLTELVK